jgi:hypothetical protein
MSDPRPVQLAASNGLFGSWQYGGGINALQKPTDPRGSAIVFNVASPGAWESPLETVNDDDGTVSLSVNGYYVTAEGGGGGVISTNRTVAGAWEKFTPLRQPAQPDGGIPTCYRCSDGRHYLRVDTTLPRPILTAQGVDQTAWQTFVVYGEAPPVPPKPPIIVRPPLPPFDEPGPDGNQVHTTLPPNAMASWLPYAPDVLTMRASCWAVTLPGLPFVPGGSSKQPQRFLSWFFDRYPPAFQQSWLDTCARYGFTHGLLSADDSMGPSDRSRISPPPAEAIGPPGNDQTLDQFVATCGRVKGELGFSVVMLASKYFSPANMTLVQFQAKFEPIFDALVAAKALDVCVPFWEGNLWNIPGDGAFYPIIGWLSQKCKAAGIKLGLHFSTYVTQWGNNGQEQDDFWTELKIGNAFGPPHQVDVLLYQGNPADNAGTMAAHGNDAQRCFGRVNGDVALWAFELVADLQFDEDQPDEAHGNLRSWETCCAPGPVPWTGYGNGNQWPGGEAL